MNTSVLYSKLIQKISIRDKIVAALDKDTEVPAFSPTARKLISAVNQRNIHLDALAEIARLDPGIASNFLRLASSPCYSGESITNIHQALSIIGLNEIRKIATTLVLINRFAHFKIKVDWELFWLHSLLSARLTELLAAAYQETHGEEYLAGLLHDIGKLFLEHHFPKEFETLILSATLSKKSIYEAEVLLFDISHAEISALLCEKWRLHPEIVRAVRFHHDPESPLNKNPKDPHPKPFLALCVSVANQVANMCQANIQGGGCSESITLDALPEWKSLKKQFVPRSTLMLDVASELQKAKEVIHLLKTSTWIN